MSSPSLKLTFVKNDDPPPLVLNCEPTKTFVQMSDVSTLLLGVARPLIAQSIMVLVTPIVSVIGGSPETGKALRIWLVQTQSAAFIVPALMMRERVLRNVHFLSVTEPPLATRIASVVADVIRQSSMSTTAAAPIETQPLVLEFWA